MTIEIEEFGFCPECESNTVYLECIRCGEIVCPDCHPVIGCE